MYHERKTGGCPEFWSVDAPYCFHLASVERTTLIRAVRYAGDDKHGWVSLDVNSGIKAIGTE